MIIRFTHEEKVTLLWLLRAYGKDVIPPSDYAMIESKLKTMIDRDGITIKWGTCYVR